MSAALHNNPELGDFLRKHSVIADLRPCAIPCFCITRSGMKKIFAAIDQLYLEGLQEKDVTLIDTIDGP